MEAPEASAVPADRATPPGCSGARAVRLLVSLGLACQLACRKGPPSTRDGTPADAGTVVTVYVAPESADRMVGRLTAVAARRRWSLSVRTDTAARAEADLAIVDSAGTLVGRLRAGSPAASRARELAEAVLP
jgi:hypothetical protein